MILKNIKGENIDLFKSPKFLEHSKNGHSYANVLVEQINSGFYNRFFQNKDNLIIYDIGANVGLWSLFIRPICQNILALEPTPNHNEIAEELFKIYDNPAKIFLNKSAISNKNGFETFNIGKINSTMNSFIKHHDHSESIEVKTHKLKTIINGLNPDNKIDFIKMDIEGAEQLVILDNDFDKQVYDKVECIYMEIHEGLGADFNSIYNKLKEIGYNLEMINTDAILARK